MRNLKIKIVFVVYLSLSSAFVLLFSPRSFAQQGSAQSVEVSGYSFNTSTANMIGVAYGVVVSKRFNDADNAVYYLDPSGDSQFCISAGLGWDTFGLRF